MTIRTDRINGSCYGRSGHRFNLWLEVTQNSQNQAARTTNVTIRMFVQRNDGQSNSAHNLNTASTVNLTIGSATTVGRRVVNNYVFIDTRNSRLVLLANETVNIEHTNANGTKTLPISGSFSMSGTYLDGGNVNGSVPLRAFSGDITPPAISNIRVSEVGADRFTITADARHAMGIRSGHVRVGTRDIALTRVGNTNDFRATVTGLRSAATYTATLHFTANNNISSSSAPRQVTTIRPVTGVTVAGTPATLLLNPPAGAPQTAQLNATVLPSNASNRAVTWSSSNPNVLSVDRNTGLVTARGRGSATIVATSVCNPNIQGRSSAINVQVRVTSIEAMSDELVIRMENGRGSGQALFRVLPSNASNAALTYTLLDYDPLDADNPAAAIATVNQNTGLVTALRPGRVRIEARTVDGGFTARKVCRVTTTLTWRHLNDVGDYLNFPDVAEANENLFYLHTLMRHYHDYDFEGELPEAFSDFSGGFSTPISNTLRYINFVERNLGAIVRQIDFVSLICSEWDYQNDSRDINEIKFRNDRFQTKRWGINEIPTKEYIQRWIDFCSEFDELMEFSDDDQLRVIKDADSHELRIRCEDTNQYYRMIAHDYVIPEPINN